jgi:3-isopropylmalate/(R)-2-methylmalate dehydratase small subunit
MSEASTHSSESASIVSGKAAPLPFDNLDTDQIMPKQFLLGIDKSGLARGVFHDMRFDAQGVPRQDFVLNHAIFSDTSILVTGSNFGCCSSREHAVWGLQQAGFRAVIASSFGEIFYFNSIANGFLALIMDADKVADLQQRAADAAHLIIDVANQYVEVEGGKRYAFEIPARQKSMFLEGLDQIGMTLKDQAAIDSFESAHFSALPWTKIDLPAQSAL